MGQRLIDAHKLEEKLRFMNDDMSQACVSEFDIADAPAVDAVPVVRCGKCKHYRDGRCYRDGYEYDKWASGDTSESPQNAPVYYGLKAIDFCSHGEPRTPPAE